MKNRVGEKLAFCIPAVIDIKGVAGDKAGLIGSQEKNSAGDFFRFADATLFGGEAAFIPGLTGGVQFINLAQAMRRFDETGADGIAANAAVAVFGGDNAGQLKHRAFAHAVNSFQRIAEF